MLQSLIYLGVVVKIMVRFGVPIRVRHLFFLGYPKKGPEFLTTPLEDLGVLFLGFLGFEGFMKPIGFRDRALHLTGPPEHARESEGFRVLGLTRRVLGFRV